MQIFVETALALQSLGSVMTKSTFLLRIWLGGRVLAWHASQSGFHLQQHACLHMCAQQPGLMIGTTSLEQLCVALHGLVLYQIH